MGPGTVAVVTGGASGIGAALCRAMAMQGAHVVVADLDGEAASLLAKALDDAPGPGSATAARVDVAEPQEVRELVEMTAARHGRLDVVVNNAGIAGAAEPEQLTLEVWQRSLDVNLRGVVHGCHFAWPIMLAQGHGHLVNIASSAGLVGGLAGAAPYTTTKHGVVGLSTALRVAGADRGIRVTVVCPGGVDTPIWRGNAYVPDAGPVSDILDAVPSPELMAPEDLAAEVLRAMARNRSHVVTPASARVGWWLYRGSPDLMLAAARKATARIRRAQTGVPN